MTLNKKTNLSIKNSKLYRLIPLVLLLLAIPLSILLTGQKQDLRKKASGTGASGINLSLYPSNETFENSETKEFTLIATFADGVATEKLDYFKTVVSFDKNYLQIPVDKYVDTSSSGFDTIFKVDGPTAANQNGKITIELGSSTPGVGPATDKPITVAKIYFRAILPVSTSQSVSLGNAQIVNNSKNNISLLSAQGFSYTINPTSSANCISLPTNDTFDIGTSVNNNLWNLWLSNNGNAIQSNGVLQNSLPNGNGYAGVITQKNICGDFDVNVDFNQFTSSGQSEADVRLSVEDQQNNSTVMIEKFKRNDQQGYSSRLVLGGNPQSTPFETPSDTTFGKLRIRRVGSNFSTYYNDGNGWRLLLNNTNVFSADVKVALLVKSFDQNPSVSANFDNFNLTGAIVDPSLPPEPANKVSWKTDNVSLEADDFYIEANNQKFLGKPESGSTIQIHSDPGNPNYTTLELIWKENGVEMRLFMYFNADGTNWWSPEVRTYNGAPQGDWVYYVGGKTPEVPLKMFDRPLGRAYIGDFDLRQPVMGLVCTTEFCPSSPRVHFGNLRLMAFANNVLPPVCRVGVDRSSLRELCVDSSAASGNYRYIDVVCADGYLTSLGTPTSCKPAAEWKKNADEYCASHSSCPVTIIPTPPSGAGRYIIDVGDKQSLVFNINPAINPQIKFKAKLASLRSYPDLYLRLRVKDELAFTNNQSSAVSPDTCNNPSAPDRDFYIPVRASGDTYSPVQQISTPAPEGVTVASVTADGWVILDGMVPGRYYTFYLKGPKTRRSRMVQHVNLQPTKDSSQDYDWTGKPLDPGDLADPNNGSKQDCTINSTDWSLLKSRLGTNDQKEKDICDVNYDSFCNSGDSVAILDTLSKRPDDDQ